MSTAGMAFAYWSRKTKSEKVKNVAEFVKMKIIDKKSVLGKIEEFIYYNKL